ncbi:MAG: hypothetical protein KDA24_00745 [Deltaproteobacteria bacterium]|nr:hypothetical protein [Deltaproteobacteria bacterium]
MRRWFPAVLLWTLILWGCAGSPPPIAETDPASSWCLPDVDRDGFGEDCDGHLLPWERDDGGDGLTECLHADCPAQ